MQSYITSSLAPWVNPSILFVCSLSSHSLDCISCSYEEMCDAPIGTTSWAPAKKWNVWRNWCVGGPRGYRHNCISSLVGKSLTCIKSSYLCLSIFSFCEFALNITVTYKLVFPSSLFHQRLCFIWLLSASMYTLKKNSQHSQEASYVPQVGNQGSAFFFTWVVYCCYNRPSSCLLSVHLS